MSDKKLADAQIERLEWASKEALACREQLHMAQILGAGPRRCQQLRVAMAWADSRFDRMMKARGLCVGDTVRVLVDGPYKGHERMIEDVQADGRVVVGIDGREVCPLPGEVVLVKAAKQQRRGT